MKVCVLGLGYIGLPTSALLTHCGIPVHGIDINPEVVKIINSGKIHIVEPELDSLIEDAVQKRLLEASTEIIPADTFLVVVPTPFKGKHEPDISYVETAIKNICPHLKPGNLLIIESTSPVGTTEKMAKLIQKLRPDLFDEKQNQLSIHMAYCPERVLPGNIIYELENNDRVIGGINTDSTEKACQFYKSFVKGQLLKTNARTAEMCKLTENASRDVQIAFANELSIICEKADINVWELIELANHHPRVNILQPGSGVGGHCIAVDPYFIVSEYPLESRLISCAREINNHKSFWCAEKIHEAIKNYEIQHGKSPNVALMGLAFKPNIDDLRESPAKYIAMKILQSESNSKFYVVEPNVDEHDLFKLSNYKEAYENADIVAYLVAHREFKTLANSSDEKIILDFCGVLNQ